MIIWSLQSFNRSNNQTRTNSGPSFSPALALGQTNSKAPIPATASMADASVGVDSEENYEDVLMDQPRQELKKDDNIPLFTIGLRQS